VKVTPLLVSENIVCVLLINRIYGSVIEQTVLGHCFKTPGPEVLFLELQELIYHHVMVTAVKITLVVKINPPVFSSMAS
jgi:hypothetical protein